MYRKMFSAMICLMLLGGTYFVPKVRADESDKKTIVTVNEPIQVPGKVLPAQGHPAHLCRGLRNQPGDRPAVGTSLGPSC